jgi:ABC-type uncharacterized transport system permease subunit
MWMRHLKCLVFADTDLMITFFAFISIIGYLAGAVLILQRFNPVAAGLQNPRLWPPLALAWVGVIFHLFYIVFDFYAKSGFSFNFFGTGSLVAMIVALTLLVASLNKPVEKLGVALFPIAALMLGLDLAFPAPPHPLHVNNWAMTTHILASIIAFSLLNIAALQAVLLAMQDRQLKSHYPRRFILSLPPLQTMESLLFQMIATGLVFLSISLISGFLFVEDLFAQHLVHKTVLSILAWIIFSGLMIGRKIYGWRGQTAMKWTLSGFASLMLAYFGSKLVLELILHR